MEKRYFGSFSLQNTIRKVKEVFPECRLSYKEDENGKSVTFRFMPDERKKYGLSEGIRTYSFINNHLILSNGCMDPFKYDKLDSLIENTELEYDVMTKNASLEKIKKAVNSCQEFHDTAIIKIGNVKGNCFDLKLTLNDVERTYHVDNAEESVHMQKLDPETELNGCKEYKLSNLPPKLQYKILKTTHPGLLTVATEYISGLREDKQNWKSVKDAYAKSWKKEIYDRMGIDAFDVAADVSESRIVGKYADNPMRRLILTDGSEYAYREVPLEAIPYSEYELDRNKILNQYKADIMKVCKATGVIPQKAIEVMNIYTGKVGPVVFDSPEEAIRNIRIERLEDPLSGLIQKINRAVKLHNHDAEFIASLRKPKKEDTIRKLDINDRGRIVRIDIDLYNLMISNPYTMTSGRKKTELEDLTYYPLTQAFISTLQTEIEKMKNSPEYKLYKFTKDVENLGLIEGKVLYDSNNNVYKTFSFKDTQYSIWVDPYEVEIGTNQIEEIRKDYELSGLLDKACDIFDLIFE